MLAVATLAAVLCGCLTVGLPSWLVWSFGETLREDGLGMYADVLDAWLLGVPQPTGSDGELGDTSPGTPGAPITLPGQPGTCEGGVAGPGGPPQLALASGHAPPGQRLALQPREPSRDRHRRGPGARRSTPQRAGSWSSAAGTTAGTARRSSRDRPRQRLAHALRAPEPDRREQIVERGELIASGSTGDLHRPAPALRDVRPGRADRSVRPRSMSSTSRRRGQAQRGGDHDTLCLFGLRGRYW